MPDAADPGFDGGLADARAALGSGSGPGLSALILRVLPEQWRDEFRDEFWAEWEAGDSRKVVEVVHRWRLRALAYSDPEGGA